MPKYMIQVPITSVCGWQLYAVEAKDPEDAVRVFNEDGGKFVEESIDIESLGEPEVTNELSEDQWHDILQW